MRSRRYLVSFLITLLGTIGIGLATAAPAQAASKNVSGSVACVSGNKIEGVFVHANSGGGGWATMNVPGNTSSNVSWSYTIPNTGSYYLVVGCGGNTSNWATTNYSNNYSGNASFMLCYDTTGTLIVGRILYRCYT